MEDCDPITEIFLPITSLFLSIEFATAEEEGYIITIVVDETKVLLH